MAPSVDGNVLCCSSECWAGCGHAVLNFPDSDRQRVMARLDTVTGDQHHFVESHRVEPDKRNFPRLYAGINVLYRRTGSEDEWRSLR